MSNLAIKVESITKEYQIGISKSGDLRQSFENKINSFFKQSKKTTTFTALNNISFEVKKGEAIGIIGRNGAGKSTLLKVLSRITEPSKGRFEISGRVSSLLEVGTGFHPELSGRENIYLNGTILGMKRNEIHEKIEEIISFSGVEQFVDTAVKHYSSGMKVRLAFSVAAHLNTEILIVDEVLAVGDIEFQKKCLGKMQDVTNQGKTIVFVSHQMDAVRKFCSRCILIENGKLKADGEVESVIQLYINSSSSADLKPLWVNSGNKINTPIFNPSKIGIFQQGLLVDGSLNNNSENAIIIEGEILEENPFTEIGYMIYNEFGTVVYTTFFYDGPEEGWPKLNKGKLELKSIIPKRILNEGIYKFELIVGVRKKIWYIGPGSTEVSFRFEINGGLSDSPIWHTKREGVIAPIIKWENT